MSKVFNSTIDWFYEEHNDKIIGNIEWYQDRFDLYNEKIRLKVAASPLLPAQGFIPANLDDIMAFLDCTGKKICRPKGGPLSGGFQYPFFNG